MKRLLASLFLFALTISASADSGSITAESVLTRLNAERAAAGLPPLTIDPRLAKAAEDRMRDMEEGAWWSHESPEGRSPFVWLAVRAYDYQYAGENLAAGFETTELLVQSWMESPGHRDNILNPNYSECGVAIIDGSTIKPAAGKSIVVMFGRRHEAPQRALAK